MAAQTGQIGEILRKLAGRLEIKNADERRRSAPARRSSTARSSRRSGTASKTRPPIAYSSTTRSWSKAASRHCATHPRSPRRGCSGNDLAIGKAGIETTDSAQTVVLDETDIELPDVLTELQDRTQLTRRTIHRVLTSSRPVGLQAQPAGIHKELAGEAINRCKRLAVVDGISTSGSATSTTTHRSCSSRRS